MTGARVLEESAGLVFEVRAPGFVWGMVRKMVSALLGLSNGTLPEEVFGEAIRGETRLTLPLASPESLVLWEVSYPGAWESWTDRRTRRQEAHILASAREARARQWLYTDWGPLTRPLEPVGESAGVADPPE